MTERKDFFRDLYKNLRMFSSSAYGDKPRMSHELSIFDDKDPRFYTGPMIFRRNGQRWNKASKNEILKALQGRFYPFTGEHLFW
jgi:hypothetical protein